MNYITRERVHVDRIATAWVIKRFLDADATFQFVPRTSDLTQLDGVPFDIRGAELGHRNGRCTFEALLEKYELDDGVLHRMARIIHAADLPHEEPAPLVAAGVRAIFDGVRDGSTSDDERLQRGFTVCDALYAFCRNDPDATSEV